MISASWWDDRAQLADALAGLCSPKGRIVYRAHRMPQCRPDRRDAVPRAKHQVQLPEGATPRLNAV